MSKDAYNVILEEKVVAIVRDFNPETVVELAQAYVTGGVRCIEVIFDQTSVGNFTEVASHLQSVAEDIENMTVIDCINFVPHDSDYFRDRVLHPNDAGFQYYADALIKKLKEIFSE